MYGGTVQNSRLFPNHWSIEVKIKTISRSWTLKLKFKTISKLPNFAANPVIQAHIKILRHLEFKRPYLSCSRKYTSTVFSYARSCYIMKIKRVQYYNTSCGTRSSHGLPAHQFFTFSRLSQSLWLALLSHAARVAVPKCVTHHLPFYWLRSLLPFLFHFSHSTHDLTQGKNSHLGVSFELATPDHKASSSIKAFVPSFLKISQPFFE